MKTVTWRNCIRVGISIFVLFLCINYWGVVSGFIAAVFAAATPILIGLTMAYVLNILMNFYERHYFRKLSHKKFIAKSRRPVCLTAAFLTLCGIIALVIWLVVPELISCVKFLVSEIPPAIVNLLDSEFIERLLPANVISQLESVNWIEAVSKFVSNFSTGIGDAIGVVVNAVTSVVSTIITVFISIIFSIYLLNSKDKLRRQSTRLMKHYLPEKWIDKVFYVLRVLNESFHRYIVGQCTEAVVLGVLCVIGMLIFRFPYAAMIGALVGFTALIPIAGAYIGAIVGAIMILTESPLKALLFIVFIIVLQQLEGNLIYPKVVGKSIGLPALWVLAAVTIGGGIAGVLGMLIGVPLTSAVYRLVREDMMRRDLQKHTKTEQDE